MVRFRNALRILGIISALLLLTPRTFDAWFTDGFCQEKASLNGAGTRVRYDAYHAHTFVESPPAPGINQYHLLAGPSRAARALVQAGFDVSVQLEAWTEESLSQVDLLVLNLVSADRPAFRISEINAITAFIKRGGGLIVLTDHTNCYFHNHVLEALFAELDLQLTSESACERYPRKLSSGNGWTLIEKFTDHPTVNGLSHIGFQTGGTVDQRFGVAWTNPDSWGDQGRVPMYGEGTEIGFYGDFQQQPFERSGPLPVVAAKEFGAGRIVVIGDQNALGGIFINYADNRKLWLQAVNWTLQRETKREADLVKGLAADPDRSLIWCLEPLEDHRYLWGSSDPNKFYNAFGLFNKHADARGTDRDLFEADWMLIADAKLLEREPWIGKLKKFLDGPKKQAVVWMDVDIDDNDKWTEGILKGQAIASMKDGKVLSFSLPNGSKLHLRPDIEAWTNKKLTGPESTRDEAVLKAEDAILNFFWSQGMKKVPSIEESVQWPDGGR